LFGCLANLRFCGSNRNLLLWSIVNVLLVNVVGANICVGQNQIDSEKSAVEFNLHQPEVKSEEAETEIQGNVEVDSLADEQHTNAEQIDESLKAEEEKEKPLNVETEKKPPVVLQGGITYTVPTGTPIKLKLATVPSHPMSLINRDFDGNLYPARLGQQITARTTEDIYVDKNKIIPEGSVLCGTVSKILPPRRVYRAGSLELSFTQLITPDGRKFAFRAEANNAKRSTAKTKAKGFGIIAAHAAGGAIVGALVAYQIFGMQNTIAMHGYNIAGGAAGGALIATGYAIMRKGPKATLEPGDDLNMVIDTDLLMPAVAEKEPENKDAELPELRIKIEKSKIANDGVGGHFVTVDATLINDGAADLSSIDLFLEDTNGDRHPLCSSPEEDSQFLFHLEPYSQKHVHLSFLTDYPKLKQQLVWVDHQTKLALIRQKIQ
jgi:hypothetical protein